MRTERNALNRVNDPENELILSCCKTSLLESDYGGRLGERERGTGVGGAWAWGIRYPVTDETASCQAIARQAIGVGIEAFPDRPMLMATRH